MQLFTWPRVIPALVVGCVNSGLGQRPQPPAVSSVLTVEWAPDATKPFQRAIDSGAKEIVIPFVGKDWVVSPLFLASNQTITFEPGVVVVAKAGDFQKIADCLMKGTSVTNVVLHGYGATLRMRKSDYVSKRYKPSQWRHCLLFNNGCSKITVEGLTLEASGGDGIYIGANYKTHPPCRDIIIRDVTCRDNHRQGISVTSVVGLRIYDCKVWSTSGNNPQAGIDIEPNLRHNVIEDVIVRGCTMVDNAGSGLLVALHHLDAVSRPVSILFEKCVVRNSGQPGIRIKKTKVRGSVTFRECVVEDSGDYVNWKVPIIKYEKCEWRKNGRITHEEGS